MGKSNMIISLHFREEAQVLLERFINACEICGEFDMKLLTEQLLRKLEEYSEKH